VEEAKQRLQDCETRLKKRVMPFGKGPVWKGLVEAWIPIDRPNAVGLLRNVSGSLQENFITQMNKTNPLSAEEWTSLVNSVGAPKVEQVALKLLDDEGQSLRLPKQICERVALQLRNSILQLGGQGDEIGAAKKLRSYGRLLAMHANTDLAGLVPGLVEEVCTSIAKAPSLDQIWMLRFNLMAAAVAVGVQLKSTGVDVMTPALVERVVSRIPAHLVNFAWAQWAGLTAAGQVDSAYAALIERTRQDQNAEAWFLVTLVGQGLGTEAMALAKRSPRAEALLPRLRRAWLCSHPETARDVISPGDMAGDPIGEFLAQGTAAQRAAYLKLVTQNGARPVPGAMWAGVGTEAEPEGLRGLWQKLTTGRKSLEDGIKEYLARNSLYSSYGRDTKKEDQFSEMLRVNGYGDYHYQSIDGALLAALVAWGDQEPQQVRSELRAMWNAIQPNDQILMVDRLRNAIMARCVQVFAADAEVLCQDFLAWLKRELVEKGRQWQSGNQVMNLKYPGTLPLQFCVAAAATVGGLSPARRDQILLTGLERFEANPGLVDSAAQLYNSDKEPLTLQPPLKLKPNLLMGWQTGIVKNALLAIMQAMAA
jgi:hypothetical protein